GTRTPNLSKHSAIFGTAAAAFSVFTVTRTSSEPAFASAITWFTVEVTSSVSVLVIDWTTIGCVPPTLTPAISTTGVARRGFAAMRKIPPKNLILPDKLDSLPGGDYDESSFLAALRLRRARLAGLLCLEFRRQARNGAEDHRRR